MYMVSESSIFTGDVNETATPKTQDKAKTTNIKI